MPIGKGRRMEQGSLKGRELTAAKLRRVLRWARNKRFALKIKYAYNNSVGGEILREYYGRIESFSVESNEGGYRVKIKFESGKEMEEWLVNWHEFMESFNPERVVLFYKNSGPYCWFSMRQLTDEEIKQYMQE